jgi:parvulin-like peptidyl-prolyl isomerase
VGVTEEGIAPLSEVKSRVELAVQKEKKGKMLAEKMKSASAGKTDLASVASVLGSQVKTASDIDFNTQFIPELGMEPAVVGIAATASQNVITEPVIGVNGVYLLKVTSVRPNEAGDVKAEKNRLAQEFLYRAGGQTMEIHRKAVEIEDKRAVFY